VFVRELLVGTTTASGKYVAFYSWATDLVPGWADGADPQICLRRL